jgi:uncharacterized paraquat-inducible protein A
VSIYVICPHCNHPTVMPRVRTGKGRVCRQCGQAYFVGDSASLEGDAIPVRSAADLASLSLHSASSPAPVYVLA